MALSDKTAEIERLINAFEEEASKFHDLQFHTFYVTEKGPSMRRAFAQPNHTIMLWQHYRNLTADRDAEQLAADLRDSDLKWGLRNCALSFFAVIEGLTCERFVRMAMRAGSLFSDEEALYIKSRVVLEIQEKELKSEQGKPLAAINDNPLAIWLNYLLYHLSIVSPGREHAGKIQPDPYSLSLLALERLLTDRSLGKIDRSNRKLADINFKVALSFPGEKRRYVSRVVDALREPLGHDSIFYDFDYQAQLAQPNLDILLQRVYLEKSALVVVFLCAEYSRKQWCGLEWRAVREIIKSKDDHRVMLVKFDDAKIDGLFSIDGFVDGTANTTGEVAKLIIERLKGLNAI